MVSHLQNLFIYESYAATYWLLVSATTLKLREGWDTAMFFFPVT